MRRFGVPALILAMSLTLFAPGTAQAGAVWDPNDTGHRFDIRWVGVFLQADGRLRITVTFYDRVRSRWFDPHRSGTPELLVRFAPEHGYVPYPELDINLGDGRLFARLCFLAPECSRPLRLPVLRPNAHTLRVLVRPLPSFGPFEGRRFFAGVHLRGRAPWIDKTRSGSV